MHKLLGQLVKAKVLHKVLDNDSTQYVEAYAVAFDMTTFRVCDIIDALDNAGESDEIYRSSELRTSEAILEGVKRLCHESPCNRLIREIIEQDNNGDS